MKKISLINFIPGLISIPSVLIGAVVMYKHQIPVTLCLRNIIFLLSGSILSMLYISGEVKASVKAAFVFYLCCLLALCSTLFFQGMEGVHRWIQFGPLTINVAFIVLPLMLTGFHMLLENEKYWFGYISILIIAIVLFIQPDASMTSAFSAAALFLAYRNGKQKKLTHILMVALPVITVLSWFSPDNLAPVSYVEDILLLAKESGPFYFFFSLASLVLLLCPFLWKVPQGLRNIATSLGLFFAVVILSTFFGNFPVPLIGYGVSPIAGYLIAVSWIMKRKRVSPI